LIERHRDRVLVGISLTATSAKAALASVVEPFASTIPERMSALREAHKRGLRTYGMLCPLLPGISNQPGDIEELAEFCLEIGSEEIFAEPVNNRGAGLKNTEAALRKAGYATIADAVNQVRSAKAWSWYAVSLLRDLRKVLSARGSLDRLRFLLYPSQLTEADQHTVLKDLTGVKWLEKEKPIKSGAVKTG
jgi:DNA repair photolyase